MDYIDTDTDTDETEEDDDEISEPQSYLCACGFMEIVIHHLIFVKNIYPRELFKQCYRRGFIFWYCKDPSVMDYILGFLEYVEKCLKKLKELDIVFSLLRRNSEVLEQFFFELKLNDPCDESDSKLGSEIDNLSSICREIHGRNTFTCFNTFNPGLMEVTFELQIASSLDDELPEDNSDRRWIISPVCEDAACTSEENPSIIVTPFRTQRNKHYEIKARAFNKA